MNIDIGSKILTLIKEKRISKKELANQLNINPSAVSRIIRDKTTPKISTLVKIAKFFGVSIDYLVMKPLDVTNFDDFYYMFKRDLQGLNLTIPQRLAIMRVVLGPE